MDVRRDTPLRIETRKLGLNNADMLKILRERSVDVKRPEDISRAINGTGTQGPRHNKIREVLWDYVTKHNGKH